MELTRRQFLKGSALVTGGAASISTLGFDLQPAYEVRQLKISRPRRPARCARTAVGCSMIAYTLGDKAPDTIPTLLFTWRATRTARSTRDALPEGCFHAPAPAQREPARRPDVPGGRRRRVDEISWDDAMDRMARMVKDAGQALHREGRGGQHRQPPDGFAFLGGATISNEEGYLTTKLMRGLGTVYLEQQARV